MFCTNCGARQNDDAKFCTNCGATLTPVEPVKPAPAPIPNDTGWKGNGAVPGGERVQIQQDMPQKKHGKAGLVVAVIVIFLALVGVGVGAFLTKGFGLLGVMPKGSMNDYSWGELSKISDEIAACESDEAALQVAQSYNLVGTDGQLDGTQTKSFTLTDGTPAEAVIIGFRHDDRTDGGKAGITFMFRGCVATHAMNVERTNAGGWEQSEMRSYLNNDVMDRLPDDLRNGIVAVDKSTNNAGESTSADCVTVTSDSLWLLSNVEVVGEMDAADYKGMKESTADINNAEGNQYLLFKNWGPMPTGTSETMVKSDPDGAAVGWWLRTALPTTDDAFLAFSDSGKARVNGISDELYGVSPCFSL